jgi:CubicO group peptidase (beta-lactamase class C family)
MDRIIAPSFVILLTIYASTPANAKIIQEAIRLPVTIAGVRGRSVNQPIDVTIFRDDDVRRAPFLILNHGRSGDAANRNEVKAAQYAADARYFVSKGFAVFFPVRVGYGAMGGPDVEDSGPCNNKNYPPGFEAAAVQTIRLIEYAKTLPYIDPANGLVVGQSYGGTTAVAVAARNLPGVRGAINFAGGGGGGPETHPRAPCQADRMTELFASYGQTARTPMLWFYSENDQYWGKDIPRLWYKAFIDHGGSGRFIQLPTYKSNGHPIFTGDPAAWEPAFEEFLRSCCQLTNARATASPEPRQATSQTTAALGQVLSDWAQKYKIRQAEIVVRRDGRVVYQAAYGGSDPNDAVHLASLSKAITGACIATLVRDGRLSFETPLSTALANFFQANGKPADHRIERVTIAQLLTHRAGFAGAPDGEDLSSNSILRSYLADHSSSEDAKPAYLAMVFTAGLAHDPGTEFTYSNAGYLTLGRVIEVQTGMPYETYCREAVLKPAGATGTLDPVWRVLGSFGGWRMKGADYLAFYDQLDPAHFKFGERSRDWMLDKTGKSYGKPGTPSWYGLGVRLRDRGQGIEYWHTGSFSKRLPDVEGERLGQTSTFVAHLADGTSWFVHSTPLVVGGARIELDRELIHAYEGVRAWR